MDAYEAYIGQPLEYLLDRHIPNDDEQPNEPIISDDLAIWIELKERENPYPTNLTNDELRFRLGRRSIVKEILDLYQKQNSSSRSQSIQDICNKINAQNSRRN